MNTNAPLTMKDLFPESWMDSVNRFRSGPEKPPSDTPTKAPESPRIILQEVTMDIVVTEVFSTPPLKNHRKNSNVNRRKDVTGKTMTLQEYYAECERRKSLSTETKMKADCPKENLNPRSPNRLTRHKQERPTPEKAKKWTTVTKKKVNQIQISYPEGWSKSLYKSSNQRGKFINTTLILKNLPYEGTKDRDLMRFFSKTCGPVKFINVLRNGDRCRGIAFVRFETVVGSDRGLTMNGFRYGNRRVYVEYARDRRIEK